HGEHKRPRRTSHYQLVKALFGALPRLQRLVSVVQVVLVRELLLRLGLFMDLRCNGTPPDRPPWQVTQPHRLVLYIMRYSMPLRPVFHPRAEIAFPIEIRARARSILS